MTGYPGAPPYGGQYGNLPYGNPFQPNFAFHSMIPPPPPPPPFAHQQQSFSPNQFAPGTQMQYGNSMAYQNNAQYQQQLGQGQYQQAQAPPFYNPYLATNMPPPYANTYNPTSFPETGSAQQAQSTTSRDQNAPVFNIPVTDPRNSNHNQADISGASSLFQPTKDNSLAALQQQGYPPPSSSHHEDLSAAEDIRNLDNDKLSNFNHSQTDLEQTQDSIALIIPDEPESQVKLAVDGAEDSYSDSNKSFDPYSATESQTPDATADTLVVPSSMNNVSTLTLPGLESAFAEPIQSEMEITHEQKKTLAIQAIQDLASRQIGFEQISKEDIDRALLMDLYIESGVPLILPTDTPSKVAEPSTDPKTTSSVAPASEPVKRATESKKPAPAAPPTKKLPSTNPDIPAITAVPNFNQPIVAMTSTNPPRPTIQTSVTALPNSVATPAKDTKEAATPVSSVNRQDYLAKLQAAKEAVKTKSTPPAAPTPIPDRSDYLARLQAAKEAVKQSAAAKSSSPPALSASQQDNNTVSSANMTSTSTSRPENNLASTSRANIDALLRQKLEALRKTQLIPTSSVLKAPGTPTSMQSQPDQALQVVATGQSLTTQEVPMSTSKSGIQQTTAPSASFYAPGVASGSSGLPGLPGLMPELPSTISAVSEQNHDFSSAQNSTEDARLPEILQPAHAPSPSSAWHERLNQLQSSINKQARKRPVASDFISSPPRKFTRLADQISSSGVKENDEVETEDVASSQADLSEQQTQSFEQIGGYALPPRPDFGPRSTSYQNPQLDVKPDLQAKEDEIRQLRQRIAEATLRKTGKSTPAMASASNPLTPSKPESMSLVPEIEHAQRLQKREAAISNGTKELTMQEKVLAAAKLQAQKHLEQIRRQQSSLSAQATKTQHETDHASSETEREQKLQRKANLEAKLTSIDDIIHATETDLVRIKQEQDKLLDRIQQENSARLALMEEIKGLLQDLEKPSLPITADTAADMAADTNEAETISTQSKVNNTPFEVIHKETDLESQSYPIHSDYKAAAGQPVPISLLSSTVTSGTMTPQQQAPSPDQLADTAEDEDEEQMDLDDESVDMHEDEDEDDYDPETVGISYENSLEPETPGVYDREFDDGQDDYEPVQEIEVLPIASDTEPDITDRDQDHRSSDQDASMDEESSDIVSVLSSGSINRSQNMDDEDGSSGNERSLEPHGTSVQEPTLDTASAQPSFATSGLDASYEHDTAVTSSAEHTDVPTGHSLEGSNETLQGDTVVVGVADDMVEEQHELPTSTSSESAPQQHFVQYESPLMHFKSYRFHPQFLETTAGGFRSLTYSHKINPNVELCKQELTGGVCNDPHCDAQHFKDITLTDNNLLLQLGSTHEGATQAEKEAYVAGLKTTIFAMRAKGLKDVNSIASEIAAYRRKFLNDPTRVIANLNNSLAGGFR